MSAEVLGGGAGGGGGLFEARVQSVHDNYITVKRWQDGALGDRTLNVAKYPDVRPSEWHGQTWTDPVNGTTWTFTRHRAQEQQRR